MHPSAVVALLQAPDAPGPLAQLASSALGLVVLGLMAVIYFLPTVAALQRKHPNAAAIGALNFFLGWTCLGWIGSFVWAMTRTDR